MRAFSCAVHQIGPSFMRGQAGEGEEGDVAALRQGQAGDGGVDDLAAGHQREGFVQAADGAGAADGPAGRGVRGDDGVVQGAGRGPGRLVVGQVLGPRPIPGPPAGGRG